MRACGHSMTRVILPIEMTKLISSISPTTQLETFLSDVEADAANVRPDEGSLRLFLQ